jgi:hypothetical protein
VIGIRDSGRMSGVLAVCSERVGGIVCHTKVVFDLTFWVYLGVTFRARVMPRGEMTGGTRLRE